MTEKDPWGGGRAFDTRAIYWHLLGVARYAPTETGYCSLGKREYARNGSFRS